MTEVVHATGPEQRRFQLNSVARWPPHAAYQGWYPRPQRRIQPLDIRRIDAADRDLCLLNQRFGLLQAATRQPTRDAEQPPPNLVLDHLNDMQIRPHHPWWTPPLASRLRVPKHLQDRRHVRGEAVNRKQEQLAWLRSRAALLDHRLDQRRITWR